MVSCAADPQVVAARVAEGWQNIRLAMGNGQALNTPKEQEDYQNGTVSCELAPLHGVTPAIRRLIS
eukprot:COSAG03_NODE_886_length_5486_cov_6.922591_4_plen_66_part_00